MEEDTRVSDAYRSFRGGQRRLTIERGDVKNMRESRAEGRDDDEDLGDLPLKGYEVGRGDDDAGEKKGEE